MKKYEVLQGTGFKQEATGKIGNYDLDLVKSFGTKEEALKCFEDSKKDAKGWIGNILVTELNEVEYNEDNEVISQECLEHEENEI